MKNNKNNNNNKFRAIWQQTDQGTDLSIEFVSGPLASIGTTNIKITNGSKVCLGEGRDNCTSNEYVGNIPEEPTAPNFADYAVNGDFAGYGVALATYNTSKAEYDSAVQEIANTTAKGKQFALNFNSYMENGIDVGAFLWAKNDGALIENGTTMKLLQGLPNENTYEVILFDAGSDASTEAGTAEVENVYTCPEGQEDLGCGCGNDAPLDCGCNDNDSCKGCTDPEAFNYDAEKTIDDGSCVAVVTGCMEQDAFNYNPDANTAGDCVAVVTGCMEQDAFNYNPDANTAGDCVAVVTGCMEQDAFNYNANANTASECVAKVFGCMEQDAFNYNANANTENQSCIAKVFGCMEQDAFNYNANANTEDQSCIAKVFGCTDPSAFNYEQNANTNNGSCVPVIVGCMDNTKCNYNPSANTSGECEGPAEGTCDCAGSAPAD